MEGEPTLESRRIYEGRILNLRVDTVRLPTGGTGTREVVEHSPTISVVARDDRGSLLMVRQYRKPIERALLEVPAGGVEPGESPEESAWRELREETGYAPGKLRRLGGFWLVPGWGDEYMHVFLAEDLHHSPMDSPEDETTEVVWVAAQDIPDMVRSGELQDAKSLASLLMVGYFDGENSGHTSR